MDMRKIIAVLLTIMLLSVISSIIFYQQNTQLNSEISSLKQQIITLHSANLVTALGIVEIPPYGETYWGGIDNTSYLWITGCVFNSGAAMARKAGLEVLAFDYANAVLMNFTVPVTEGGIAAFSTNESRNLIPSYLYPTALEFGNVLSQENVTVRMAIFHDGVFPNDTRYEINPVWENTQ